MSNHNLLDLFRQEVATHTTNLKASLSALKSANYSPKDVEQVTQSAHGLWGVTRLIEIEELANLAQLLKDALNALKDRFNATTNQATQLEEDEGEVLSHCCDLLLSISHVNEAEIGEWLKIHTWDLATTQKTLARLMNTGGASLGQSSPESIVVSFEPQQAPTPEPSLVQELKLDASMFELFRLEVETQAAILNNGLLVLEEKAHSAQELEALMRAAHSIKGAARILGVDGVVELAHVMEDCFVAAQNQALTLTPEKVDILLHGVDLLQNLSQLSLEQVANWLGRQLVEFQQTQKAIANLLNPDALVEVDKKVIPVVVDKVAPSPSLPQENDSSESGVTTRENLPNQDRVVRVSADNLNRIMGLAGESLIEANWLQPFADAMTVLKGRLTELSRSLEQLEESTEQHKSFDEAKEYLNLARQYEQECFQLLGERLNELELYVRRTANLSDRLYREVITSHMRPFADGVGGFPRMIRDLARQLNKQVKLEILGKSTPVDRDILKKLEAPLTHILRNALDHGLETPEERVAAGKPPQGTIRLEAVHRAGMLGITISDDGRGINLERLRKKIWQKNLASEEMVLQMTDVELLEFLFLPGFSTAKQVTEISGRGVGLDIAKSMVQEVRGTVRAVSQVGKGTSFHFQLPLTLSVVRTLLVEISGKPYAIPLARIEQITTLERSQIADVENRQYLTMNQQNVGLIAAYQLLELPRTQEQAEMVAVVVISDQSQSYGLVVDRFLEERDLVVKPLDPRLGKVPDISATASLSDGSPILILDVSDLVRSMDALLNTGKLAKVGQKSDAIAPRQRKQILVVDDSITVREMERKLLENHGYDVDTAVNGMEGWNAIRTKNYDVVITDIDMPRMNGIELVRQIRGHARVQSLPVIIVSYRDREEDRLQGLEVGANYYLTKSSFHDETFLEAVVNLVGH